MDTMLFTSMRIRGVELKNRIVPPPVLTCSALDGHVGDWHSMHLDKYAAGGCGLVFMEAVKVDPRGRTTPAGNAA